MVLTSRLDVYISTYGDFCAHDDNNDDMTDYFTPCACARGNYDEVLRRTRTIGLRAQGAVLLDPRLPYLSHGAHYCVNGCE